jgi:hypothetical protein
MSEGAHPFVDNGEGFPTSESVSAALEMFNLGALAEVQVSFRGHPGSMVELITHCKIDRLTENWPNGFVAQVIGSAAQAGENSGRS